MSSQGSAAAANGQTGTLHLLNPMPVNLNDFTDSISVNGTTAGAKPHNWCQNCIIGDPTIVSGNNNARYTLWTIEFQTERGNRVHTRRRYNDFVALRRILVDKHGKETYIMKLPRKTYFLQDRFQPEFLEERRRGLEYWLNSVVLNPVLGGTAEVKQFVLQRRDRSKH